MHSTIINQKTLLDAAPIKNMLREKTRHVESGLSYGLTELGYDVRLAENIHFIPYADVYPRTIVGNPPEVRLRGVSTFYRKGRFILGSTMEEFDMPTDMMAMVKDKSSWARKGLSVFNTVINPGQKGFITLELVFNGEEEIFIPAGTPIAQIIFQMVCHPVTYQGHYENQEAGAQPAVI